MFLLYHSCSFKDPMCFRFSNSGYMPATKINHYILPLAVKISDSSAVKICSIRRSQNQRQMWDQAQNHQKTNPMNTLRPRDSFCLLLVSSHFFYPNFKRPSHHKSGSLNNKYIQVRVPPNIPKQRTNNQLQCTNPSITSPEPLPKRPENPPGPRPFSLAASTVAPQRSAARPRRHGLSEPRNAAPYCLGAEDATRKEQQLRLPSRNKKRTKRDVSLGCWMLLGKILNIGHR